jgi:hypothetical protein
MEVRQALEGMATGTPAFHLYATATSLFHEDMAADAYAVDLLQISQLGSGCSIMRKLYS